MRYDAKHKNKAVPTRMELESLALQIKADDMRCPCCRRTLHWLGRDGISSVVTLQHDTNGDFRLICHACNTRHSKHPGDSFYEVMPGERRCFGCGDIKRKSEFYKNRAARDGLQTLCKECQLQKEREKRKAASRENN